MGKVQISKHFTSSTIFSGETNNGSTTGTLNISRFNHARFYAQADTGAASFAATISLEVSPDGTNFFTSTGILLDSNINNSALSAITLATASSEVFGISNIGAIHTLRFTLNIANRNASTSVDLFFSLRTEDD